MFPPLRAPMWHPGNADVLVGQYGAMVDRGRSVPRDEIVVEEIHLPGKKPKFGLQ